MTEKDEVEPVAVAVTWGPVLFEYNPVTQQVREFTGPRGMWASQFYAGISAKGPTNEWFTWWNIAQDVKGQKRVSTIFIGLGNLHGRTTGSYPPTMFETGLLNPPNIMTVYRRTATLSAALAAHAEACASFIP